MPVLDNIRELLCGFEIREVYHQPTLTSKDSAKARGEDISIGGKAILLKYGNSYGIFVLSAAKQIDSIKIRKHFNIKKSRFASKEELLQLTNLTPGSVPPFGRPIFNLNLFVDKSIVRNENIAFNAGTLTDSIIMLVKDYLKVAKPEIFDFSK
jgi:Ala-tRNA(Pro) deacylase